MVGATRFRLRASASEDAPKAPDGEGNQRATQRVLRPCWFAAQQQRESAIVREHDAGHVTHHYRCSLDPGDERGRDEQKVDGPVGGAEQVPTLAERIGQARQSGLALEYREREV